MIHSNKIKQSLLKALKEITWDYNWYTCIQLKRHFYTHIDRGIICNPPTQSIRELYEELAKKLLSEQLGTQEVHNPAWLENMLINIGMTSASDAALARENLIVGLIKQLEEELNV